MYKILNEKKFDLQLEKKHYLEEHKDDVFYENRHFILKKYNIPTNDDRVIVCPICGFISSTLNCHIPVHKISSSEFKDKYPNFPLYSKMYIHNVRVGWDEDNFKTMASKNSKHMVLNNPMKAISVRKKVSKTRKRMFREDSDFKERMAKIQCDRSVKVNDFETRMKLPGWGISGRYKHIYFRSTNELKFLLWADDNSKFNFVKSNVRMNHNGEFFLCDFRIGDVYYEIKDKTYAQDEREEKQFRIIEEMRKKGKEIFVLNKGSDIIKSISFVDILESFLRNEIIFTTNSFNKSLYKRLIKERDYYETNKT